MNHLELHVEQLQEKVDWLASAAYKYHFEVVTTQYYGSWTRETLEEHIFNEWQIDRMKLDDIRRELKHYKNLLAIYTAEQKQGSEQ
ncbi:hypothetical protein [Vibrio diazotrophicus]|uniref:hypothetical protein n=1 Tax=Vibrio diazotrophicus TaxID=685 RepID=UPI000C9E4CD5|nr:hypothetical protein [Vibrio diazotrophicus]PNH81343.1 hypothetical protein C1N27_07305 [Vibrio diazotrophicus]